MPRRSEFSLNPILEEVQRAIDARLHYLAVAVSFTIPDICAACETETRWATPEKYKQWCGAYLTKRFKYMTADDCWRIRCGTIHTGMFGQQHKVYHRILFTIPSATTSIGENLMMEMGDQKQNALVFDIRRFCNAVAAASREWFSKMGSDELVKTNLDNVVRLRPGGMLPFFHNYPVIT